MTTLLQVVRPDAEHEDDARSALRLAQYVARRAAPANRLLALQPAVAADLGFSVRTIRSATRVLEATELFVGVRQGNEGVLYRLLAPVRVIAERLGVQPEASEPRSEPASEPIRTSGDVRARDTSPTTPTPTSIGDPDPLPIRSSSSDSSLDDEISRLNSEGRLELMGMGHSPDSIVVQFCALSDDDQRYCIDAVENADPPTNNPRFLAGVMRSLGANAHGNALRRTLGLRPRGLQGSAETTELIEIAVASAIAAVQALREVEEVAAVPLDDAALVDRMTDALFRLRGAS